MAHEILNRYSRRGLRQALFAGAAMGVLASAAMAQVSNPSAPLSLETDYLGYSASVSPRVTVSDNIQLTDEGQREDDVILSTLFSAGAIVSTKRATAILLGDVDFSYLTNDDDFVVNQNIGAASTFTVADNWVYVDASGRSTRQLLGDNARFSDNTNAARNQNVDVHSFSLSPYIYHQMPDQSTLELRYRFSQVFIDDADAAANPLGGDFLNDSTTHEAVASFDTGALSERLRLRLTAYGADTNESGSDQLPQFEYEQASVFGEAQYALSRRLFLSGAIGYDELNLQSATALFFDEDELSGLFWRAGLAAKGRRSLLRVEYGERYGGEFIDAEFLYELTSRLVASGGANRLFRSRTQGVSSTFRETQARVLDFAEALREGATASPRAVVDEANDISDVLNGVVAQTIGVSATDNAYLSLAGTFGETRVTFGGVYEDSNFGFRQLETYGLNLQINHRLSRRLSAYGDVRFRRIETTVDQATCQANPVLFGIDTLSPTFDPIADCALIVLTDSRSNTFSGRFGTSFQLAQNVALFGEYTYAERFAPAGVIEYTENVGTVGLILDF